MHLFQKMNIRQVAINQERQKRNLLKGTIVNQEIVVSN